VQNMERICRPNFWGRGGKVETFTPYISKMGLKEIKNSRKASEYCQAAKQ